MAENRRLYIYDGLKSSLLWDEDTDAWTYLNFSPSTPIQSKYQLVPTLFRGVNIIANAVAKMPFKIYRRVGDKEIDTSQSYQNKVGFLPVPHQTFCLISMSLDLTGSCYFRKVNNAAGYPKLFYQIPTTITPMIERGILTGFARAEYGQNVKLKPDEMIYLWLPDPYVELGPPTTYPAQAAFSAASVLYNMDAYIALYFARGAIRPIVISVKGAPNKDERERMEKWFQKLMGGIRRAFEWKVLNADTVDIKQVGDGLDSLQDTELTSNKRQEIAHALGIPYAILFSEAANYATAKVDQISLYSQTIEPRCEFIATALNDQLFMPAGYRLEFQPETLDIYQEDEAERAAGLSQLVSSGVPLLMAMDILGFELTAEQRAELEQKQTEKEQLPESRQNETITPPPRFEQNKSMSGDMRSELSKWYKVTCKAIRSGKPKPEFESMIIPPGLHGAVSGELEHANTIEDVKRVFADLFQEH